MNDWLTFAQGTVLPLGLLWLTNKHNEVKDRKAARRELVRRRDEQLRAAYSAWIVSTSKYRCEIELYIQQYYRVAQTPQGVQSIVNELLARKRQLFPFVTDIVSATRIFRIHEDDAHYRSRVENLSDRHIALIARFEDIEYYRVVDLQKTMSEIEALDKAVGLLVDDLRLAQRFFAE